MTTDYVGAVTEIKTAVNAAINFYSIGIIGYVPFIQWPGYDTGTPPDASKFWGRFSTQGVSSGQKTLSENVVSNGSRRFETFGLVFFQWFAPKVPDAETLILKLSAMIQKELRKGTNNVILRNVRFQEVSPENGAVRKNIVAEFEFDEIN